METYKSHLNKNNWSKMVKEPPKIFLKENYTKTKELDET
jgi:hypothetical protein